MSPFCGILSRCPNKRFLIISGIALLACLLALSGCTQPVIPSPLPAETTPPQVTTLAATMPPTATTIRVTQTIQSYLPYTNQKYQFSITYPDGWTKQENTGASVVVFTSPTTSAVSDIPATMRITVDDLTANPMSLDQYRTAQLAKRQGLDSFNLIYNQAYKGNGFSGWKVAYTANQGTLMEWVEVYAIKGATAYTVTFSCRQDRYAGFVVQMDTMFKSLQLTG